MRTIAMLITAVSLSTIPMSDAFAQRGLLKGGLSPIVYNSNGRIACCTYEPAELANTCTGYYQACMGGYRLRGFADKGLHDCSAARAVCLRTGVWDTRQYGRNGRYLAGVQQR